MTPRVVRGTVAIATGLLALVLFLSPTAPWQAGESGRTITLAADVPEVVVGDDRQARAPYVAPSRPPGRASSPEGDVRPSTGQVPAPLPTLLRIEAVGIEAAVVPTDTDVDGVLEVPPPEFVGWFRRWPAPGAPGPAVLAGHVDSRSGPGALFALARVEKGMTVEVDREDGSTVSFVVDRVETVHKDRFPTEAVYGEVADRQLRVITCAGPFDASTRSYRDNLVVFATQVAGS